MLKNLRLASNLNPVGVVSIVLLLGFVSTETRAKDEGVILETEFQNGNNYSSLVCDTEEDTFKLHVDTKRRLTSQSTLRFVDLDRRIRGDDIEILSARLDLFYVDEYWSKLKYHIAATANSPASSKSSSNTPVPAVVISGDKLPKDEKTPRPSWVSIPIDSAIVQDWVDDRSRNSGLVLSVPQVNRGKNGELIRLDPDKHDKGSLFVAFRSCKTLAADESPKLIVRYRVNGNAPPTQPGLSTTTGTTEIYSIAEVRWEGSSDPNPADSVTYEFEVGVERNGSITWSTADAELRGESASWNTASDYERIFGSKPEPNIVHPMWYRVRAVDQKGAASAWVKSGPVKVSQNQWVVWGTDGSKKIWPDSQPDPAHRNKIKINAARNEWEPLQIAVRSNTQIDNISISMSSLHGPDGSEIPAAVIYRQHYLPITKTANKDYGHLGLVPDGLVPLVHPTTGEATGGLYGGSHFDLSSGGLMSFWLDIFVPKTAAAGVYNATVTVTADGLDDVAIPVQLNVFNFTLPSPKNLTAAFQLDFGSIRQSHPAVRKLRNRAPVESDLSHMYEEMLHDHYINNWSPRTGFNYGLNGAKVTIRDRRVDVDWTGFDALVEPYMNGTAFKDGIPAQVMFVPYWIPTKKAKSDELTFRVNKFNYKNIDLDLFGQFIQAVEQHMIEKGWIDRAMVFYFDEPFISPWKYSAFIETAKVIREKAPRLKIMITDGYKGKDGYRKYDHINEGIEEFVDVWNPVTFQVSSLELANYYRERKKQGHFDLWNQTLANSNPNRGVINLFPEYDLPFHRMWGAMSWNFGFQGIEWWSTIIWWDPKARQRLDPWTDPVAFPAFRQPLNSDGRLFFPGTFDAIGGPDIPVSSIRMKAVREAIEDYEYLHILEQLGHSELFDMDELHTTELTKSNEMTTPMPMGNSNGVPWHWWEGDPDTIMKIRVDLARTIERLSKE